MIDAQRVETLLRSRYPDLVRVGDGVFRGIDRFLSRDYAIRYFDLNDRLAATADSLKNYQEEVLAGLYFSSEVPTDLRWNHYLYFVTSKEQALSDGFGRIKAKVESDREYARKQVVPEEEIARLLASPSAPTPDGAMPVDLATTWMHTLERQGMSFILDGTITVPDAARRILSGATDGATRPLVLMPVQPSEQAAASRFIKHLTINGYRQHPEQKSHPLGRVNLIVGSNGVGKTSLLEAIEYAYCGTNRRESPVLPKTSIVLDLLDSDDQLTSTTDAARLRARHSYWYAKSELRTVTIQDSFGKFNFLDTDAAVDLSVSTSSEQIGPDVTRLVLGAAAENLADRLRRVLRRLGEERKDLQRDNDADRRMKRAAEDRLAVIASAPKRSDALFLQLLASTTAAGWQTQPLTKEDIGTLRVSLGEAMRALDELQNSSADILQSNPENVVERIGELQEAAQVASQLAQRFRDAEVEQVNALQVAHQAIARNAAVQALLPYANASYAQLVEEASRIQASVRSTRDALAALQDRVDVRNLAPFREQVVSDEFAKLAGATEALQHRLEAARASLKALEKTQGAMTVLRQRLQATAQDLLRQGVDRNHCPLCKTKFDDEVSLATAMANFDSGTSDHAKALQLEVHAAEEALMHNQEALAMLRPLFAFARQQGVPMATVAQTLNIITEQQSTLHSYQAAHSELLARLKPLEAEGLSLEDLARKLLAAGLAELPPLERLREIQSEQESALQTAQSIVQAATNEADASVLASNELASSLSLTGELSPEDLATAIEKLVAETQDAQTARSTLAAHVAIEEGLSTSRLVADLAAVQEQLLLVTTAVAQEGASDAETAKEAGEVTKLGQKIGERELQIQRAMKAEILLEELATQSSGGELAGQILAENAQEIARTFASIHMPNEFELTTSDGTLQIVRRSTGAQVQLHHMSTGQRAAFALSLFLAMNGRLRSGPPVLLFDDPVAHIDDINMLSFLDHLRRLAITGSRQIFFATSDTKLAGLFRHKFRFLGDGFKEVQLARET